MGFFVPMRKTAILRLLTNHLDAWGLAFGVALVSAYLHDALNHQTWLIAGSIAFGYWLAFALNDYFDREIDRRNRLKAERNYFCAVSFHPATKRLLVIGFGLAWLGIALVFAQMGWRGWLALLTCFTVSWGYSAPPLRLKTRPGLDLLTHAGFVETFPYLLILFLQNLTVKPSDYLLIAILLLASACAQLEQQIRDFESEIGVEQNLTIQIGKARAVAVLKGLGILYLALGGIGFWAGWLPAWLFPLASLSVPIFVWRLFLRTDGSYPTYLPKTRPFGLTVFILFAGFTYLFSLLIFGNPTLWFR
jgi:4-hydroxybenzoate polyprenyltransferase